MIVAALLTQAHMPRTSAPLGAWITGDDWVVGVGPGCATEFAVTLRNEARGLGFTQQSLDILIDVAREAGGRIAAPNTGMLDLARCLGFSIRRDPKDFSLNRAEISLAPD